MENSKEHICLSTTYYFLQSQRVMKKLEDTNRDHTEFLRRTGLLPSPHAGLCSKISSPQILSPHPPQNNTCTISLSNLFRLYFPFYWLSSIPQIILYVYLFVILSSNPTLELSTLKQVLYISCITTCDKNSLTKYIFHKYC